MSPTKIEGYTSNGDYVRTVSLTGPDGMTASILTRGGRLCDLRSASGRQLLLPLSTLAEVEEDGAYIGVAVGRTANRIRGGQAPRAPQGEVSNPLEKNENGVNHIHGGRNAWDKRLFTVRGSGPNWVSLYVFSPEYDQGYPSAVEVEVRYELRGGGALHVDLCTKNVGAVPTITNMTLHPYFDLSGNGGREENCAMSWVMRAETCAHYLPLDKHNTPTGEVASVENTPYDFRSKRPVGQSTPESGGFDTYLVNKDHDPATAQMASLVYVEGAGMRLEVMSNQPGFQVYTSNGFDGSGKQGFAKYGSIAIEPSMYIDAGNNEEFPSISLAPGVSRKQSISYIFTEL